MNNKLIKTIIIFISAILYSIFLVVSSLSTSISYKNIEQKEIIEKSKNIPKIYFEGNISDMSKKTGERIITVKYKDKKNVFKKYATVKIQGNSSAYYPKKNYTIKFYNNKECTDKFNVDLGWGYQHKYVIKANWVDKTHARNIVTARLAAQMYQKYNLFLDTPNNSQIDGYPVELYVNNEFYGLYTVNIPKDNWMMNMDKKNPNHILLGSEGWLPTNLMYEPTKGYKSWEIEVGEESEETLNKLNRLIIFLNTSTDEEFKTHAKEYIDIDSTIIYYIVTQTFCLSDNVGKNMLIATYDSKIWYPVLYDLESSFGVAYNGLDEHSTDKLLNLTANKLFERLENNYSKEIITAYFKFREDVLTLKNISNQIDDFYLQIPNSLLEREMKKWGPDLPGFDTIQMKNWIRERLPIMDNYMNERFNKEQIVPKKTTPANKV